MMKTTYLLFYTFILAAVVSLTSCKKPLSFSNGNLSFSADTLVFDTVFTTIGSVTKRLKIYNNSNKTLKIASGLESERAWTTLPASSFPRGGACSETNSTSGCAFLRRVLNVAAADWPYS